MSAPLVTIMIPSYNQAASLPKAIESALAQTYSPLEVLVSDDASTDETASVVATYAADPRFRYERATENRGRVRNYRHTIETLSRGDWVMNLDGDDFLTNPGYVAEAMRLALSDPRIVLVFGRQSYLDAATGALVKKPGPDLPAVSDGLELLRRYFALPEGIPHLSAVYKKAAALEAGVFLNDITFADAEAMIRILSRGRIGYVDRVAGTWVDHGGNASHTPSVEKRLKNLEWIAGPARDFEARGLWPAEDLRAWKAAGLNRAYREAVYFYLERRAARAAHDFQVAARAKYPEIRATTVYLDKGFWIRLFFPRLPGLVRRWRSAFA